MIGRNNKLFFKWLSLNIRSTHFDRFHSLCSYLRTNQIDIACLQETSISNDKLHLYQNLCPDFHVITHSVNVQKGITILTRNKTVNWKSDPEDGKNVFRDKDGRLLIVSVHLGERPMTIGNLYAPANEKQRKLFFQQWQNPQTYIDTTNPITIDIICGDWNMVESSQDRSSGRHPAREELYNMQRWKEQLSATGIDLVDRDRKRYPSVKAYTHTNSNRGQSRVDRIYLREDWYQNRKDWTISPLPSSINSDHDVTSMTIGVPLKTIRGPGRWRLPPLALKVPRHINVITKTIEDPPVDTLEQWDTLKTQLQE